VLQGEQMMSQATDLPRQSLGQECLEPALEGAPVGKAPHSLLEEFAHRGVIANPSRETALRLASGLADRWRGSHPKVADHIEECLTQSGTEAKDAGG
jgi:hypothetical protein